MENQVTWVIIAEVIDCPKSCEIIVNLLVNCQVLYSRLNDG
jgi:hypothetical protein